MYQLIDFFSRQRAFILFVLLEALALWCVYKFNNYPSAVYFNTSNYYVAKSTAFRNSVKEYSNLREVNNDLAAENARLHQLLSTSQNAQNIGAYKADSVVAARFKFIKAKVVRLTVNQFNNFITIDKGTADGLRAGMGVVSATGVVGRVKVCNEHYSVVYSILHSEMRVSAQVKRSKEIGSVQWDGINPDVIKLNDVSRYKSLKLGDTIVTSAYNKQYGEGVMIGIVKKLGIQPDQTFWDTDLKLSTNFGNLAFVYVINNQMQTSQEAIEALAEDKKVK